QYDGLCNNVAIQPPPPTPPPEPVQPPFSGPPIPPTDCNTPDLCARITNITAILNRTLNVIFTMNGSGAVAWRDGVRDGGLGYKGSIDLHVRAIGIRVEMKTLPEGVRVLDGMPPFYLDAGFITPIALLAPLRWWRLVFDTESFALPQFTDSIGFTLLHGTVVDIVELLPVFAGEDVQLPPP